MHKRDDKLLRRRSPPLDLLVLLLGVLMIGGSFVPLGKQASESMWTEQIAAEYSDIRREYHRSLYQPPARSGISEDEQHDQQEQLKARFDALTAQLAEAQNRPRLWRQILLGGGVLLTALGAYFSSRQRG